MSEVVPEVVLQVNGVESMDLGHCRRMGGVKDHARDPMIYDKGLISVFPKFCSAAISAVFQCDLPLKTDKNDSIIEF